MRSNFISYTIVIMTCLVLATVPPCHGAEYKEMTAIKDVRLSTVVLTGSSIIPDNVRDKVVAPYQGKLITFIELELIRNELTMWLVDNGFINSGVVIPDQEMNNGIVRMLVVEGKVTSIDVSGTSFFSGNYFSSRLGMATKEPFNLSNLRDTLQLLHQDPQIHSISANLSASAKPGESKLSVKVSEGRPWSIQALSSNDNPPATGSYRGEIALSYRNAIGYGDLVSTRFGVTEGGFDISASASVPVTPSDTIIEAFYRRSDYKIIDHQFRQLDIRSEAETIGGKISHPLVHSTRREVRPFLSIEQRESRNFLLGQGFSFSDKEDDGLSKLTAVRLGMEWLERSPSSVMLLSSIFSFSADSSEFLSWNSRLMWMQRTGLLDTRILVRGEAQITDKSLPSMEKYAIGGMNSVRGFRKNVLVRDNAAVGSLEYIVPLIYDKKGMELFAISAFFDYGSGWDSSSPASSRSSQEVAGSGMAIKASWQGISADLSYAFPVIKPDNHSTDDLQDKGFHFLVTWSL